MAEAVKVALIRDARVLRLARGATPTRCVTFERAAMAHMIRRCAELHMRQIAHGGDPFETGSARPLDYGHWSAHKLETLTHTHLRHGEAVAIGIALDTRYSVQVGMLAAGGEERICTLLEQLGFRLWHPALEKRDADGRACRAARACASSASTSAASSPITLLRDIGVGVEVHEMDEAMMLQAIAWLQAASRSADAASRTPSSATSPTAPTSIPARPGPRCCAQLEAASRRRSARRLAPGQPFGVGLRLRRAGRARRCASRRALAEFQDFLAARTAVRLHHQRLSLRHLPRRAR